MQTLGLYRFYIIICLGCVLHCSQLIECHRSDVYIAGFFPYGVGKENSETGKLNTEKNIYKCSIFHGEI